MKKILFILLSLPLISLGQKFLLIDDNSSLPILYTDSVSVEQIKMGYFPVETQSVDTFLANVNYLIKVLKESRKGARAKMQSFKLKNGNTEIEISRVPHAYGDRYRIVAHTTAGDVSGNMTITNAIKSNKYISNKLKRMISYIVKNNSIFEKYREVEPKIYNMYVITE